MRRPRLRANTHSPAVSGTPALPGAQNNATHPPPPERGGERCRAGISIQEENRWVERGSGEWVMACAAARESAPGVASDIPAGRGSQHTLRKDLSCDAESRHLLSSSF